MTFFDVVRNALLAGLGLQETVKEFLDGLVKKGELSDSEGAKLFKEWSEKAGQTSDLFSQNISELVAKSLKKLNLLAKDDIERLNKEVRSLSKRLSKVEGSVEEARRE